jgi:hypothetical protein
MALCRVVQPIKAAGAQLTIGVPPSAQPVASGEASGRGVWPAYVLRPLGGTPRELLTRSVNARLATVPEAWPSSASASDA